MQWYLIPKSYDNLTTLKASLWPTPILPSCIKHASQWSRIPLRCHRLPLSPATHEPTVIHSYLQTTWISSPLPFHSTRALQDTSDTVQPQGDTWVYSHRRTLGFIAKDLHMSSVIMSSHGATTDFGSSVQTSLKTNDWMLENSSDVYSGVSKTWTYFICVHYCKSHHICRQMRKVATTFFC